MKTKKIISKFFLVLIVIISFYLHSCERGEWCAECNWDCETHPIGSTNKTFCADSYEDCEAEVQEFLSNRFYPDCWHCSEPNQD
jgi:hypothetical protein